MMKSFGSCPSQILNPDPSLSFEKSRLVRFLQNVLVGSLLVCGNRATADTCQNQAFLSQGTYLHEGFETWFENGTWWDSDNDQRDCNRCCMYVQSRNDQPIFSPTGVLSPKLGAWPIYSTSFFPNNFNDLTSFW
jgi:hypothetical protein